VKDTWPAVAACVLMVCLTAVAIAIVQGLTGSLW
jgi:hypothetical protein